MYKTILTGRVTKDVETVPAEDGTSRVNFTVATPKEFKDKVTGKVESDFVRCTAFSNLVKYISEFVKKGDLVGITGRYNHYNYEKDGEKRYGMNLNVQTIEKLQNAPKKDMF